MVNREEFFDRLREAGIDTKSVDECKDLVAGLSRTFVNVALCYMFSSAGIALEQHMAILHKLFTTHIKSELRDNDCSDKITQVLWSLFEVELMEGANQIHSAMLDPGNVASMVEEGKYFH